MLMFSSVLLTDLKHEKNFLAIDWRNNSEKTMPLFSRTTKEIILQK